MHIPIQLFFFLTLSCCALSAIPREASAYCVAAPPGSGAVPTCVVKEGLFLDGTATATFEDDLNTTGWGVLKVKTSSGPMEDTLKMFAAGYLEGLLTRDRIEQQIQNMWSIFFDPRPDPKIEEWLDGQDKWVRDQIAGDYTHLSDYWKQVALIMSQYDGMIYGYQATTSKMDIPIHFAFQMLSGWGDFLDIIPALADDKGPDWQSMTQAQIDRQLGLRGHCSALIKVLGDMSDLYMAQSAWFSYQGMNRIYKHYYFDVSAPGTASKKVSFSSYPGCLVSIDDFYMMDSGLVMLQTTNSIINSSLYDYIDPYSLLAWQRVRLANAMAPDGETWVNIISQHNSGTYNNQYMVIDLKKFMPGKGLADGALWVAEQIPGKVEFADETEILRYGYWPSYNVPFFPDIWKISGYAMVNQTHANVPRAQIFRRDQGSVVDFDSMKKIMRFNNYKVDPYSQGDPGKSICSRFDLEEKDPGAGGCYDSKVTSYTRALKLVSESINGPTTQNGIPPFSWTGHWESLTHQGMPTTFNFDFEVMDPNWG